MGKMILDDLRKRLERLDEDADLMIDNNDRYQMVIVGGSAFILLGKLTRATHDIDALSVPKELYSLLGKYDINTDVEAYIDNFPYNFQDRLQGALHLTTGAAAPEVAAAHNDADLHAQFVSLFHAAANGVHGGLVKSPMPFSGRPEPSSA